MNQQTQEKGIIAWFINNHVAANILMMTFILGGFVGLSNMRTETFPSIDPRLITVSVIYPGATPTEITDSITNRVEESLNGIDGVKRISSTASEGSGVISIQLEDFADSDDVYKDVETSVNSLIDFPPQNAERPIIKKIKVTPMVMTLALHGDVTNQTLKTWSERIEQDLKRLDNVSLTSVYGIKDYEISIEVSQNSLRKYGLTLQDVSNKINQFSLNVPAGAIDSSRGDISLRIEQRGYVAKDFTKIPIKTLSNGTTLLLKDIANIIDGFEDANLISRFNGENAAFIQIKRNETDDTLAIAKSVKSYLEKVELPRGISLSLQLDETTALKDRINLMLRNAILGFMLVFVVLLLFLDLKLAFWVSVAVPTSFMGGIMIMYFMGYSINMITLFALIVVLGIVVDDAIVTGESIFEEQERDPEDPTAVSRGVKKVIAPVTVGVTTTMAAFAPLAFSTGILGQIIKVIPVVVIPVLFISLLEAYFVLPSHLSSSKRWSRGIVVTIRTYVDKFMKFTVNKIVSPIASFAIKWRYATIVGFICFMMITFAMVKNGVIRFIFFPAVEGDEITINVKMPQGTPFELTKDVMFKIEKDVAEVREEVSKGTEDPFQSVVVLIGQASSAESPGANSTPATNSNIGQVKIQLMPSDFRKLSSLALEDKLRNKIGNIAGIEKLEFLSSPIGEAPDIEIELAHPDESVLSAAVQDLKNSLLNIKGTKEVSDSFKAGNTEYVFEITDEGLAVGLTPADIGNQLRSSFYGITSQRFQRGKSEMVVYVRYPKNERSKISTLQNMRIRLPNGSEVPLVSVANIKKQIGFSQIDSVNGRRIVSVTSDTIFSITTPNEVIGLLREDVLPQMLKKYEGLDYSFEGESREQAEDLQSLNQNMIIAVILIYILLGGQLRSYLQPVIIMMSIPFAIVGAIWGHYLLGADLTFISMFGMVALAGVVVNDSVVLIDYLNNHKDECDTIAESCLMSVRRRFRPILLTTLTTSLGLLPMFLETSMQAKFLIPMVISLATGILFVTVVVLVLIPVMIVISDDVKRSLLVLFTGK